MDLKTSVVFINNSTSEVNFRPLEVSQSQFASGEPPVGVTTMTQRDRDLCSVIEVLPPDKRRTPCSSWQTCQVGQRRSSLVKCNGEVSAACNEERLVSSSRE